jgi:integrase/recombinase XerD
LNVDQVKMLLDSDPKTLIELRNYAIINLVLRSALRCVEISRINVEDVIRLPIGLSIKIMRKGHQNRDQEIGITQKALSPIDLYLVARGECQPTDPLFANCSRHCINKGLSSSEVSRIISNELKFKKLSSKLITPHSLRHTAAINALKYGADLWDISKLLGHTNITTTQIYLEALTEETYKINPAAKTLDDVY